MDIFEQRKTYIGRCCVFNYQRPSVKQLQLYRLNGTNFVPRPLHVNGSGQNLGLSIVVDHLYWDFSYTTQSNMASTVRGREIQS